MAEIDLNLDEELAVLKKELEDSEAFFNQVKTHYDRVMNSKSSGTFKFITDQTSNIMNIRNGRVNIVKEMINLKKLKAEMQIKEMNINKDSNKDEGKILEISRSIYDMMKADKREGNVSALLEKANGNRKEDDTVEDNKENNSTEDELLNKRFLEIREKKQKEQKEKEIKERGYIFACDMEGKLYAVNLEGTEIYEDVELPDFEITFTTDPLTNLTIAKNQYGDTIDIIEVV